MTEAIVDRDTIWGFAQRTRKNLLFILGQRRMHEADVHEVTQLTLSLLGLIVFPYEHYKPFQGHSLQELYAEGWPSWNIQRDDSKDFDDLIFHIRNAISHRNIRFSSDGRNLDEVEIEFEDWVSKRAPNGWTATINGAQLLDFTLRFADLLDPSLKHK